ncbi:glycoside hydrolase domain-containing protein [Streptomyces hypolithicus]
MTDRRRRSRTTVAVAALLAALGSPAVVAPASHAAPADKATRTVTYQGYQVKVPRDWKVVDLAEQPGACVRFDQPAVYLGRPGEQNSCPTHLVGRTAGLLIEPIDATAVQHSGNATARARSGSARAIAPTSDNDQIQVAVEAAGVLVTAAHTPGSEASVRRVLDSATLTPDAERTALPASPREDRAAPLAAVGPQPGTFQGKGFDACTAPSQGAMDAWLGSSPYRAVGIYISGPTRACGQANLTSGWVSTQTSKGWRLIPIDVGKQAPCSTFSNKMSTSTSTARSQGAGAAGASVTAAQNLGIPAGSAIYSDIEGYASTSSCKAAVLSYLSGWTDQLHAQGYLSGVYSSASSGIRDAAAEYDNPAYTRVDHIWFAWWNNAVDTNTGSYAPAGTWSNHQRIHQYAGDVSETWGGVSISIDRNYLDVAAGTGQPATCGATNLSFTGYPTLRSGSTGSQVNAAQCLLEAAGHDPGANTPSGTYDAGTVSAARSFQTSRGLAADGVTGPSTWTALLSRGSTPTVQRGSTGEAVTRLQRSLTAALGRTVGIDGDFGPNTEQAVRDYQSSRGLSVDGVAGPATWSGLQAGK